MLLSSQQGTAQPSPQPNIIQPRMSRVHRSRNPVLRELAHLTLKQFCKAATTVIHSRQGSTPEHRGVQSPPCTHPNVDTSAGFDGAASTGSDIPEHSQDEGTEPQTGHFPGTPPVPLGRAGPLSSRIRASCSRPLAAPHHLELSLLATQLHDPRICLRTFWLRIPGRENHNAVRSGGRQAFPQP